MIKFVENLELLCQGFHFAHAVLGKYSKMVSCLIRHSTASDVEFHVKTHAIGIRRENVALDELDFTGILGIHNLASGLLLLHRLVICSQLRELKSV